MEWFYEINSTIKLKSNHREIFCTKNRTLDTSKIKDGQTEFYKRKHNLRNTKSNRVLEVNKEILEKL